MTKMEINQTLTLKAIEMGDTVRDIRIAINLNNLKLVDEVTSKLEREVSAFTMLVNGAKQGDAK